MQKFLFKLYLIESQAVELKLGLRLNTVKLLNNYFTMNLKMYHMQYGTEH